MTSWKKALPLLAALLTTMGVARTAHARSGQAAYHFHSGAMITAARYEPLGSVLRVRNPQNGREVTVRVVDRGPFNGNRILDLSTGAFSQLYGGLGRGVGPVQYSVISRGGGSSRVSSGSSKARAKRKYSSRRRSRKYRKTSRSYRRR